MPRAPQQILAALAALAAVAVGLFYLPDAARRSRNGADAVGGLSPLERRLLPGRAFDLDAALYLRAAEVLPPDARYLFVTGPHVANATPLKLSKALVFAPFWLLPRRMVTDPREAGWVLGYGADPAQPPVPLRRRIDVADGLWIGEVRR